MDNIGLEAVKQPLGFKERRYNNPAVFVKE
jgi:hypothetical protein